MSGHDVTEPMDTNTCLVVPITPECSAHWTVYSGGWPMLVIDYGGVQLMLEVAELQNAEVFALSLARTALGFASHCRYLMDDHHG